MRVRTLLYLCRLGLKNLWHNRVYSAASIITMSACIFLFGTRNSELVAGFVWMK